MQTRSSQRSGEVRKAITVQTDAKGAEVLRLGLSFRIVAPVELRPRSSFRFQGLQGDELEDRLLVHPTDGRTVTVPAVEVDQPELITVRAEAVAEAGVVGDVAAEPGDVWIVGALLPRSGAVRQSGRVKIQTDHPDAPELVLPFVVRTRALVESRPPRVQLRAASGQRETTLQLRHSRGEAFEIDTVEVSPPGLLVAAATSGGPQPLHTVRVALQDGAEPEAASRPLRGVVRIAVKGEPPVTVEVPATVLLRPAADQRRPLGSAAPGQAANDATKDGGS